ncbi:MAG: hypothetical protein ACFFE7_01080 [Candidatus Thorarchaeota archaeon]
MRSMRLFNKTFTLLIVSLFVVSFSIAGSSAALPSQTVAGSSAIFQQPIDVVVPADEGTNLDWYTDTGNYNDTWTWSNNYWLFGPRANYELFFNNGSQIHDDDYVPINEEITWRINIPKSILRGASIDNVYINGWYVSPDMNFSASFAFDFYNSTPITWSASSSSENYTTGVFDYTPYVEINAGASSLTSDSSMYYVNFKVRFLSSAPMGLYNSYINLYDRDGNYYDVRSRWATDMMMSEYMAVGIPRSEAWTYSYYGGYTLEKQDLAGDQIYSVSRGTDFMMRFNITGNGELDYAMLWTYLPTGDVRIPINRTGFHTEMITHTGGWVFDPAIQTYVYNSSIQYTVPEGVYGDYIEYDYYYGSDWRDYEYRYIMWNETSGMMEVESYTTSQEMNLMYIYNFTSNTFELLYGFQYWSYPLDYYQPDVYEEYIWYLEPVENAPLQIYALNDTLSNKYVNNGIISVEFVGHFTDQAPKGATINFNDRVVSKDGYEFNVLADDYGNAPMTYQEYLDAKQVAVESPVTIAKLLKQDHSDVYGWFFPADPGTPFEVQGRLQGGADLATDIDGALFSMKSYDSIWTENMYMYTDMYYEILVGADNSVTFSAYNYTAMENRTFGYHWEWQEVQVTDWHWEYNVTSGETEWVYGEYWTSEDVWVEGWYWEWFYFNQKDGEWVSSQDWYCNDVRSEMTKVNIDFAEVIGITHYNAGGDLYYSFLVNLTNSVREITHWWDFNFANNTWVIDPSSGTGFHDVAVWRPGWVHTFDYMGEDVFVEISSKIGVFNSTIPGSSDWMSVDEVPYITIDGVDYPIKVRNIMYPYSSETEQRIMFWDNGGDYYELLNGTKIYIQEQRSAFFYNVTIPGYGSFISAQKDYIFWDDGVNGWYSWWDIYGNIHQGTDYMIWGYNVTVEFLEASDAIRDGYYLRIGEANVLKVKDYPINDPRTGTVYVIDEYGTRYDMTYDPYSGYYYMEYETLLQRVSYVSESYEGTFQAAPAFIADWGILQAQWFTTDGHHEMPYPGALADWRGVYYTTTEYDGKVPTTKTITVSDVTYFLGGNPDTSTWYESDHFNHTGFWVIIDSTNYTLDGQKMWHALVNGTSTWQPMTVGGSLEYGSFAQLAFQTEGTLETPYTYYVEYNWNSTYYYESNWTVSLGNGSVYSCEPRILFEVYLVDANGTLVYTYDRYPYEEWLGGDNYVYYIVDLDGALHYVDYYYELPALDVVITEGWDVWGPNGTATFHYFVNGTEHIEPYSGGHGGMSTMVFTNGTLSGKYFFRYANYDNAIYNVSYMGGTYKAVARSDYIYQIGSVEGQAYTYTLAPIESVVFKNFQEIIVGNPRWALWGVQTWAESESNNALDLDGDLSTTDDQYYVLSEYQSTNSYYQEWTRMWVNLMWDPNGTIFGDEMLTDSWMGVETYSWSYQWQETFYWFHADDLTPVGSAEWDTINNTIFDAEGLPRAGYWDIAHMGRNVTWEDILAEAEANGWDWFDQGEQEWTWLSFGVGQHYGVDSETGYSGIDLRYEYSGLMIWEDTNNNSIMEAFLTNPGDGELTHYFIPDSVGSVSFVTPGMSFGVTDASGHLLVGVEDEITWGVTFSDINGTVFPFNAYAYWDWYGGVVTGSDLKTFDERPTKVTIDELSFLVHFQGFINETEGATNNYATLKVDNTVGQWGVNLIGGIANLEGKSLALNYLADVSTSQFRVEEVGVDPEQTIVSDRFQIGDNRARFAEMIIGGVTYEWAADPYTAYNVTSQTTPFSTFTSAYQSEDGKSATSWSFTSTQYYVSIGFPHWDGYYVYQDPIFVGYVSNSGNPGGAVAFNNLGFSPSVPSSTDAVTVGVDLVTDDEIFSVALQYSTDGYNFNGISGMWSDSPNHWVGEIPSYPEDTQVWYKVVVTTNSGTYESDIKSYIVGQGAVTEPTEPPTTPRPTGPSGPIELSTEMLLMLGGVGVVVVVLGVMAKRRK